VFSRPGTETATPEIVAGPPLPSFSDWRVAYIGPDQHLHAVSLDGKTDVAGMTTPVSGFNGTGVWPAGTSPDGKHLAYYGSGLTVLDAASGMRTTFLVRNGESAILWSPDQRYLAFNAVGVVMVLRVTDGRTTIAPPVQSRLGHGQIVSQPFGWLDATHVAVYDVPASTANTLSYQSLDVTTGDLRPLAAIPTTSAGTFAVTFAVTPGGAFTLFSNAQFRNDPFTPMVALIDNATGAVTPLPRLTQLLPALGGFHQVLWRPGSSQALVAMGFPENGDLQYHLIDVRQDTATPLNIAGFPEAWSPDGGTLIVSTGSRQDMINELGFNDVGSVGIAPLTLTALTLDGQGRVLSSATLTTQATTIPVLGFVRTA
jgi:hypothetical protein